MPSPPPCLSWQPVITQPRLILLYSASGIESVCWKKSCHWRSSRTELEGSSPGPGPSRAAGPESVIGGDVTLQAGSSRAVVPATNALLTAPNCLWKGEDCAHGDPCISGRRTAMHCPYTSHSCLRGKKKSASFMESFHVYLCIYEFNALFAYLNLCLKRKKNFLQREFSCPSIYGSHVLLTPFTPRPRRKLTFFMESLDTHPSSYGLCMSVIRTVQNPDRVR